MTGQPDAGAVVNDIIRRAAKLDYDDQHVMIAGSIVAVTRIGSHTDRTMLHPDMY